MNTTNPNSNSNPQAVPEKQSPLNPNSPAIPNKDSTPKAPDSEGDKQDRTVKPQGNAVSAIAIVGILAFTGMGIGTLSSAHADPTTPVASEYCSQLAEQFDKSLSLHEGSEHLAEANRGRSLGWDQCVKGDSSRGEMTLKTAIRDLGVRPVLKEISTRK